MEICLWRAVRDTHTLSQFNETGIVDTLATAVWGRNVRMLTGIEGKHFITSMATLNLHLTSEEIYLSESRDWGICLNGYPAR